MEHRTRDSLWLIKVVSSIGNLRRQCLHVAWRQQAEQVVVFGMDRGAYDNVCHLQREGGSSCSIEAERLLVIERLGPSRRAGPRVTDREEGSVRCFRCQEAHWARDCPDLLFLATKREHPHDCGPAEDEQLNRSPFKRSYQHNNDGGYREFPVFLCVASSSVVLRSVLDVKMSDEIDTTRGSHGSRKQVRTGLSVCMVAERRSCSTCQVDDENGDERTDSSDSASDVRVSDDDAADPHRGADGSDQERARGLEY